MRNGLLWGVFFVMMIFVAFCAAFMLSVKFYIEPAYDYITKNKIEQQIADLKHEISEKDKQIHELTEELDAYVHEYGELEDIDMGLDDPE